jgi:sortase A
MFEHLAKLGRSAAGNVGHSARGITRNVRLFARERQMRSLLPYALILGGAAVLLYVSAQYALMARDQHQLAQRWAEQNTPAATAPASIDPAADSLVRITIPKINVDAIVIEGTSAKALMRGPGHIRSSAYPGENGNVVISAHRDTFFRHIVELAKGDQIELQRGGTTYTYEVTGKKITDPNDLSVIQQTPDARLTLITCYPTYYIGPAPERLAVFARLVSPPPDRQAAVTPVSTAAQNQPKPE